ncbi:hypothetical protein ACOSP7_016591 [Xanthoceras sorbifolium]
MVSSLKTASGDWNTGLVRSSFSPEDADVILVLPPFLCQDTLCWHFDKARKFFVRSAYWLAMQSPSQANNSSLSSMASWWRYL